MRFLAIITILALCGAALCGTFIPPFATARAAEGLACPADMPELTGARKVPVAADLPIRDAMHLYGPVGYACATLGAWQRGAIDDKTYISIADSFRTDAHGTRDTGRDDITLFLLGQLTRDAIDEAAQKQVQQVLTALYSDPFSDYFDAFKAASLTVAALPQPTPEEMAAMTGPCTPQMSVAPADPAVLPHSEMADIGDQTLPDGRTENRAGGNCSCSMGPATPTVIR